MNSLTQKNIQRGFTIVEIIIALLIICIMTLILVPVYTGHAEKARAAACDADLQRIAEAETQFCVETGSYVRMFALDDLYWGDGLYGWGEAGDSKDGICDEGATTASVRNHIFATKPDSLATPGGDNNLTYTTLYISPTTGNIDANAGYILTQKFAQNSKNWGGPYYTIQRDEKTVTQAWDTSIPTVDTVTYPTGYPAANPNFLQRQLKGIPNDPWGHDYLFFTKAGLVQEPEGVVTGTLTFTVAGVSYEYNCKIFDRPTILSLGPNGFPGDGSTAPSTPATAIPSTGLTAGDFGKGDDRYQSFER